MLSNLHEHISRLLPLSVWHGTSATFVFREILNCTQAFLQEWAELRYLQKPYKGPYKMLDSHGKTYTLKIQRTPMKVSIDRMKQAFILFDNYPACLPAPSTTSPALSDPSIFIRKYI